MTYRYVNPTRWNQEPDDYEHVMHCKKCGWHIYADLEGHYYQPHEPSSSDKWQHKDCYERQKQ